MGLLAMRRAVFVALTAHEYTDPRNLLDQAKITKEACWEGYFICDQLVLDPEGKLALADPTDLSLKCRRRWMVGR